MILPNKFNQYVFFTLHIWLAFFFHGHLHIALNSQLIIAERLIEIKNIFYTYVCLCVYEMKGCHVCCCLVICRIPTIQLLISDVFTTKTMQQKTEFIPCLYAHVVNPM